MGVEADEGRYAGADPASRVRGPSAGGTGVQGVATDVGMAAGAARAWGDGGGPLSRPFLRAGDSIGPRGVPFATGSQPRKSSPNEDGARRRRSTITRCHGLGGSGVEGLAFGEDAFGDAAEFANNAEPREDLQGVVGDVDFPPVETLARRCHVIVVVVVPTFAESDEREKPIVLASVGSRKAAFAEDVRERIDGERAVP